MNSLVSTAVHTRADALHDAFLTARPFKHVVINGFFTSDVAEAMLAEFPACKDPSKLVNEFGGLSQKNAISDVEALGGIYATIDEYIRTPDFLHLMEKITGIPDLRYDPWYYGAGTHENFDGARLDAHYDFNIHPNTQQHRRLNAIVYLNKDWPQSWGGSIRFHRDPWDLENDEVVEVSPDFNRCVVFETTERSWHSVPDVQLPADRQHLSRKSFTIYLYTDMRPESELAPEHGTVYVQDGLPRHISAGRTLTERDYALIAGNIRRRHEYLRQMYRREYKFSEIIANQKKEIESLRQRQQFPLVGYAKLAAVEAAPYDDNWMGARIGCTLLPLRPIRGLRLHAYRPEALESIQVKFHANGQSVSVVARGTFTAQLNFTETVQSKVALAVEAQAARVAGSADERELSVIVDRVELIE